jgi:glycosyltransferase involved in cell wall biosynthesis
LRILFCNYEYPPLGGGGGVVNALLAEELASRHEVAVLTSRAAGAPRESVERGVRVVRVPVWFRWRQATASMLSMLSYVLRAPAVGLRDLARHPCDVINTHFVLPSGPVGDHLARRHGVPNVLSVHGGDLYDPSKLTSPHRHALLRSWIRRLVRRADAVVGQSRNTLDNLARIYSGEARGIRIPLGIRRPPADGPASRAELGLGPDDLLLVTVGRVVARKAIDQLLETLRRLEGLPVHLLVVGTGPLVEPLERRAAELGLAGRARFLGHVEEREKFRILRMCDLFVSTSQHEGFGLVFLEAMVAGLPVICYDHGGQTDFLEDGLTGHLLRLNDLDAFAARCRELLSRADRRRQMARVNEGRVEEYLIDRCAEQYERVFEAVVSAGRGPA